MSGLFAVQAFSDAGNLDTGPFLVLSSKSRKQKRHVINVSLSLVSLVNLKGFDLSDVNQPLKLFINHFRPLLTVSAPFQFIFGPLRAHCFSCGLKRRVVGSLAGNAPSPLSALFAGRGFCNIQSRHFYC